MPTYRFQNLKTKVIYEDFMSIAEMEKLKRNKNAKQTMNLSVMCFF